MSIDPGSRLGPYEVVASLGAGGMGEVYKALDTRLNRTVALKVLPAHLSADPERRQRFEREAQTIAALNHPHICTLFDVGSQDGIDFLVMEHLEGETLAARLARGALPLNEALSVAIAVADALEKAHAQGVTHRDLKPGNIMLTPGGAKLLDFGLAKLQQPAQPAPKPSTPMPSAASPLTTPGMILGTMQYMAPEQLEGSEADARTDLFAFGLVLYEMVTGRRAFEGKSQPHLIAAILSVDPEPVSRTQREASPALDFLIARCLAKDPERRLQTATDLVWELQWIAGAGAQSGVFAPARSGRRRLRVAYAALGVTALLAGAMATLAMMTPAASAREETRFLIEVPHMPVAEAIAIAPDGQHIAFSARDGGTTAVFLRPIDVEVPKKLAGTEGAERLFWSRDGRSIAFFADGRLQKVDVAGGAPQSICETPDLLGGTWNGEDEILFASSRGLYRVMAIGGEPVPVVSGDESRSERRLEPYFLPDGRHYLYLADTGKEGGASIYVGSLDSSETTRLLSAQSNAVYVEPGYLLYHRRGTLYAHRFDADDLQLVGDAIRIADRTHYGQAGAAAFAASQTGTLIYRNDPATTVDGAGQTTGIAAAEPPLLWINRAGRTERASVPGRWIGLDLSPDGRRAAAHRHEGSGGDLWIFDEGQSTPSRFTFDAAQDNAVPVWSPDGTRIAFGSRRNGKWGLYVKAADNTRDEERLLESDEAIAPMHWSPDGSRLIYRVTDPKTLGDVWVVPLSAEPKPMAILRTPADERNPQVSPDGRWMAYSSNETGRSEIYVRPFPEGAGRIQVSVNGGVFPRWRRDSRELYFMSLVSLGAMMASEMRVSGSSIQREVPRRLFQTSFLGAVHASGVPHAYAVTADGSRFLIPQFETPNAAFATATVNVAVASVLPSVMADRRGGTSTMGASNAPITVVLDWDAAIGVRR